ncbi:hypothetical protein DVH24_009119 [Malus domestica]|uniref:Uncharacterized protein n=1 Tax=Malus domestica TaxID=3750 RepID=A0A498JNF4_MALDO|nr:hypothetical protein DVH24_009119 [Malus domestica]
MMKVAVKVGKILSPVVVRASNKNLTARIASLSTATATATTSSSSFGNNPCVDLYLESFNEPFDDHEDMYSDSLTDPFGSCDPNKCLKSLLPLAWSHDSLTTLKLICNLANRYGTREREFFHTTLVWLHNNHPKTLACNIEAIAGGERSQVSFGSLRDFVIILYRLLLPEGGSHNSVIDVAIHKKGVLERYERDPNYQFLHNRVSDVFAADFRSDFEKLKKKKPNEKINCDDFSKSSAPFVLGPIARNGYTSYNYNASCIAVTTIPLCESIARKVFPRGEEESENEVDYTHRVLNRLIHIFGWGNVKAGKFNTSADVLLPHKIICSELQWKAMVEDLSNKGKLKNCLAVCEVTGTLSWVSVAMGLLVSQLSDHEPWKGKVIPFTRNPDKLHLIQGNDLESKRAFLSDMKGLGDSTTTQKVLNLILQEALNANLKPEHMIKKVLVFAHLDFDMSSSHADHWPITYQAMRSKFEEKGYVVPHIRVAMKVAKILSPVVVRANNKNLTRRVAPYTSLVAESSVSTATATASSSSFGKNPCLDLYHELATAPKSCKRYLDPILLTLAWSHDPLTTLKLICNLGISRYITILDSGWESFHTALLWLHQNHPKTLACNVEAIVGHEHSDASIGCLQDFVLILYQLLLPEGASRGDILYRSTIDVSIHKKGVLERYESDPNYQFLHDRVSDVFAANFRSDFEKLKKKKPNEKMYHNEFSKASAPDVLGPQASAPDVLGPQARYIPYGANNTEYGASVAVATTFLCESIARKVFPCELDVEKDEAHYTHIVLNRLSKEVLDPVWSMEYCPRFSVCKVRQYLEDVKASKSKIAADALLPHEIIRYVNDPHADNMHDVKYYSDVDDS